MELVTTVNDKIEAVEAELLTYPQVDVPLEHNFAPGVYLRTVKMPAGSIVIGHEHKTKHFNIVLTGKAKVVMDNTYYFITAPAVFVSEPGVRKVLHVIEEMIWSTVHPTDETEIEKLEEQLIVKSQAYLTHTEMKTLNEGTSK